MKQAIISVYFGSRDTVSMDLLDAALQDALPEADMYRAFLSSRFSGAESLETVLEQLRGYDRIVMQAMLVSRGPTFSKLQQLAGNLPVGAPLLDSPAACAAAMADWLEQPLVLMAHGAEGMDLTGIAQTMPDGVWLAAMEGAPTLSSILPQLAGQSVHLAPFLLTAGHHADKELHQWKYRLEQAGCSVTLHTTSLAHNPKIREIFTKHLAECGANHQVCHCEA